MSYIGSLLRWAAIGALLAVIVTYINDFKHLAAINILCLGAMGWVLFKINKKSNYLLNIDEEPINLSAFMDAVSEEISAIQNKLTRLVVNNLDNGHKKLYKHLSPAFIYKIERCFPYDKHYLVKTYKISQKKEEYGAIILIVGDNTIDNMADDSDSPSENLISLYYPEKSTRKECSKRRFRKHDTIQMYFEEKDVYEDSFPSELRADILSIEDEGEYSLKKITLNINLNWCEIPCETGWKDPDYIKRTITVHDEHDFFIDDKDV